MIFLYLLGSVLLIILLSAKYKIHPVISLIIVSFFLGLLLEIKAIDILKFIFEGILNSFYGIGLIIYLSCVIGQCLKKSSSLIIFSQILINTFKNKTLSSLNIIGLFIGSVVFCDSAFLVLSGLTKSISSTATYSLNSLNLSLAGGLYTSHNLIPPTPGPVAILNNLNSIDTFVKTNKGYKTTGQEGYVAIDRLGGDAVKIVDRLEFSYNNFSPNVLKGWDKPTRK